MPSQPSPGKVVIGVLLPAPTTLKVLAEGGIVNQNRLAILRLGPYSPMLNPIEGCWNSLKAKMKHYCT
ncbi:hypothetical protein PHPALM_31895 [Phytophthora palmivora]|uniref:Tc1-like transposase DDE domain-containing protein n=1 Tax=Phytophthora palmivora TaxID=4796 RepID=A0A2P4X1F0_9STRA|nr:hypothetical protein PHPALM_31895 [Phytophthora palmivora]